MNDSIDQNVYDDLHARVNDGDDGRYGISNRLERLDSSRNQVVLAWDTEEPLLIHDDLKTCQQCGSKMRNAGGEKECKDKRCDECGWSVMRNGFPALVKLDHGYPRPTEGDMHNSIRAREIVPGYTTQIRYMNELAHKHRNQTPDMTVAVGETDHQRTLGMGNIVNERDLDGMTEEQIENMNGSQISSITLGVLIFIIALALWMYRVFERNKGEMSTLQILLELCLVIYYPVCYVPIVLILMYGVKEESKSFKFKGETRKIALG